MEAREVLASWERQAEALLAGRPESDGRFGVASLEQLAGKSGLEVMRALLAGELPAPPISGTLDFMLIEVEHGRAVFQGRPLERHYNPLGSVHGGWFATLLDSALGCSVHAALPAGKSFTTLELKVNMLRALNSKVGLVRAEGRVIHVGGQVATAEARLVDAAGKLYAHGTTTCLVFDFPQKRAA
jgi:uncharacterized protein (TIGR00369 family)